MADSNQNTNPTPVEEEVRILPPDRSIKKKIGENIDLNKVISREKIEKAQEVIEKSKDEILEDVHKHLKDLENAYKKHFAIGDFSSKAMQAATDATFGIKSAAGMAGYSLASDVAKMFHNYMSIKNSINSNDLKIIEPAIDALRAIFSEHVEGNGGKMGKELLDGLSALIQKYSE